MDKKHPYRFSLWLIQRLPWLLINLRIAGKGKDSELVNVEHRWYNIDDKKSGCYYCKKIFYNKKWK